VVITSARRGMVLHLPLVWLSLSVATWVWSLTSPPPANDRLYVWGFALLFSALALGSMRLVRRVAAELVIWSWLGARRRPAARSFVAILTRGARSPSLNVELMIGDEIDPLGDALLVSTHLPLGTSAALRAGKRIAHALDVPGPRLASWLR
jgi:hypothetical protein